MGPGSNGNGTICAGCGLLVRGGIDACQAIFDGLLTRDFTDAAYFRVHRIVVDTYSLQHPDRYCASAKSFAAHLTGLCWLLEKGGCRATGSEALRRWLDGTRRLDKLKPPSYRGDLTIAEARGAKNPDEYARAVDRWARSTWSAYAHLQGQAREWIREALEEPRRARR